jgi:hypothetical protein
MGEFSRIGYVEAIQEGSYGENAADLSAEDIACLEAIQIQIDPTRH